MEIELYNNYSRTLDTVLQVTINSGFLTLKDFYKLSKVDKFLNIISKKYSEISRYFEKMFFTTVC